MASYKSMSVTDEIKSRIDIVELVGQYTQLRKTGRNYKALCPFHQERTPSFVVFPESQNWRCFGACGEGGDIFSFVMKKEGVDFPEALRMLAQRAGVQLEERTPQQAQSAEAHQRLRSLLAEAARFFHEQLLESRGGQAARRYVEQRGLRQETLRRFEIGYAPEGWDVTLNVLQEQGYRRDELVQAGLVVVRDDGGVYDRFRDRLVIPIRDSRGHVAGFGARGLAKDAVPKYINSPQSEMFDKGGLLFGLDLARRSIRESETAVIVEGYMDVIQAHQAGYTNVVAQMGTALTEPQLRLLARYATRLILALDPDTAGQMATQRGREVMERVSRSAAEQVTEQGQWDFDAAERDHHARLTTEFDAQGMVRYEGRLGFDIRVAALPEGRDPDDVIRETPEQWPVIVGEALPVVEYVIRSATAGLDLDDPKVKSRVAQQIVPLIEDVADPVERNHYRQRLARLLRVEERALFLERAQPARRSGSRNAPPGGEPPAGILEFDRAALATPTLRREAFCLAALIQYPMLIYQANRLLAQHLEPEQLLAANRSLASVQSWPTLYALAGYVTASDFAHPEHRAIYLAWEEALSHPEVEPVEYLLEGLDGVLRERVEGWLAQPLHALMRDATPPDAGVTDDRISDEAIQGLLDLRRKRLEEHLQQLHYLIGDLDDGGSVLTVQEYGDTIRVLTAARNAMDQARRLKGAPAGQGRDSRAARLRA